MRQNTPDFSLFCSLKYRTFFFPPSKFSTMLRCITLALVFCILRFFLALNPLNISDLLQWLQACSSGRRILGLCLKEKRIFWRLKGTWLEFLESLSLRLAYNSFNFILSRWRIINPNCLLHLSNYKPELTAERFIWPIQR